MEWAQVLVIVLPVMLAIVIGIIYNNRRLDDLRSDMNQRFADMNQNMNQRFADLKKEVREMCVDMREIKNLIMEFLKKEAGV